MWAPRLRARVVDAYDGCMRDRRYFVLIPVAALLAVLPLILRGTSCGHDIEFHLCNWLEVSSQWIQAVLLPRWDFTAAWNSGEPRFIFYPPLSWIIGAALGLFLPWIVIPTVFIWLALTASGFAMHRLAREWTTPSNALIAACLYMVHPYMLFNIYERAAYAELLAAAWLPLLLLGILRPRLTITGLAIPVCLLWLSNDPTAVIGCYSLALLGMIRVVCIYRAGRHPTACFEEAAKIAAGTILGIGLAAFYILPAVIEQHWVQINMPFLRGVRYQDNFAFGYIGNVSHDAILRTASLCGVILLILSGVFAAISLHAGERVNGHEPVGDNAHHRAIVATLVVLACVASFLLTAPSAFLWSHVPELKYLQFPWRFCSILGVTTAALSALAMRRTRLHPAVALALTLAFTLGGNWFFRQPCYAGFDVPGIVHNFYSGGRYDPTDEYTPVGADPFALDHANPMLWIAANPEDSAPQTRAGYSVSVADRLHFSVLSPVRGFVVLSLRDYPAWRITVNGAPVGVRPHRKDGLIALPVNIGVSKVDVTYARTPDQTAGWIISALSSALLFFIWWKRERTVSQ